MFGVFLPFMRYRDLKAHSSRFRGIFVIFEVSRINNSFLPFRGYFSHFWIYRVILKILRLFRELRGFRLLDILCFRGILVISEYNGHYSDFLGIFLLKKILYS